LEAELKCVKALNGSVKVHTLNSCLCKDCLIISTIAFSSSTARIDLLFPLLVEYDGVISASIALRIDRYKDFSEVFS
jgi:hypothetical protein